MLYLLLDEAGGVQTEASSAAPSKLRFASDGSLHVTRDLLKHGSVSSSHAILLLSGGGVKLSHLGRNPSAYKAPGTAEWTKVEKGGSAELTVGTVIDFNAKGEDGNSACSTRSRSKQPPTPLAPTLLPMRSR